MESRRPGKYTILLVSSGDTGAEILATTAPHAGAGPPLLPNDSSILITENAPGIITASWKPIPSQVIHGEPIAYCVSVNTQQNFASQCAAHAYRFGDVEPPLPPNAGFGFSWEKTKHKQDRASIKATRERFPGEIQYTCIEENTSYTFTDAIPGMQYFFDVYAVNTRWNSSVSYRGTHMKTATRRKTVSLKDGRVVTSYLKRTDPNKRFKYRLPRDSEELLIVLEPCYGEVSVVVTKDGASLNRTLVRDNLVTIVVRNVTKGLYTIKVKTRDYSSASFRLLVTMDPERNPYPDLPVDTGLLVLDRLVSCQSLTVAWLTTPTQQQYCVYVAKVTRRSSSSSSFSDQPHQLPTFNKCLTARHRRKAKKVACKHTAAREEASSATMETVRGLEPGEQYVLEVYAKKKGGRRVMYQRTTAMTKNSVQAEGKTTTGKPTCG